ncbi:MAG: SIS domain-containing protein [Spirochaetales bacterium]|uniref:SIS domain-containing protein n=1 Tax=Candidatus Thalassospirochaeta sargassi TaxID=3119039 RepID=A0AAJ1IJT4_9SPIO|nr:SIS domain-containing protein [Spirochaetales bacterium]
MNKQNNTDFFINDLITRHSKLESSRDSIAAAAEMLIESAEKDGKFLICGNGGSSADADHIVGELMKGFVLPRSLNQAQKEALTRVGGEQGTEMAEHLQQGIPAISLSSHTALNTAFLNDVEPSLVFAQQVMGYGKPGDIFWGISTSGNSTNVAAAAIAAKACGLKTLAMTGRDGGRLNEICDICIKVDEKETFKIQELHLPVYHSLCLIIEDFFFA